MKNDESLYSRFFVCSTMERYISINFLKKGVETWDFLNIKLKIIGLSCEPQKGFFDIKK